MNVFSSRSHESHSCNYLSHTSTTTAHPPINFPLAVLHPAFSMRRFSLEMQDYHLAYLRSFVVVTDADATFTANTLAPEAVNGHGGGWHSIVGEEQPETEHWLGEHIEDSVADDFTVDVDSARAISKTPDDRVDGPEKEGESGDGSEEGGSLGVLLGNNSAAIEGELVDNDKVSDAGHGVVSPSGALLIGETGKETSQDHDEIGNNGNKETGTVQASKEAKVQKQEWSGNTPVDVTSPVDFTVKGLVCVGNVLVRLLERDGRVANTLTRGHGKVGDGSESGDEGSQDVEKSFLNWHTEGHGIKRQ